LNDAADVTCARLLLLMRACKVVELLGNSLAELCWHLPATREQFRVSGHVTVVGSEGDGSSELYPNHTGLPMAVLQQQRLATWERLSDAARASYL